MSVLVLEYLFGAELRAQALDQLLFREDGSLGGRRVGVQLVDDRDGRSGEAAQGPLGEFAVRLGLLLGGRLTLREADDQAVARELRGSRVGHEGPPDGVLLADGV